MHDSAQDVPADMIGAEPEPANGRRRRRRSHCSGREVAVRLVRCDQGRQQGDEDPEPMIPAPIMPTPLSRSAKLELSAGPVRAGEPVRVCHGLPQLKRMRGLEV